MNELRWHSQYSIAGYYIPCLLCYIAAIRCYIALYLLFDLILGTKGPPSDTATLSTLGLRLPELLDINGTPNDVLGGRTNEIGIVPSCPSTAWHYFWHYHIGGAPCHGQ